MDFFGKTKTQLESLKEGQIYTLFFSALSAYFVMLVCGTLGAPTDIADIVTKCAHENIESCLLNGIQICETVSGTQDPSD